MKTAALCALRNLMFYEANHAEFVAAGGVGLVVDAVKDPKVAAKQEEDSLAARTAKFALVGRTSERNAKKGRGLSALDAAAEMAAQALKEDKEMDAYRVALFGLLANAGNSNDVINRAVHLRVLPVLCRLIDGQTPVAQMAVCDAIAVFARKDEYADEILDDTESDYLIVAAQNKKNAGTRAAGHTALSNLVDKGPTAEKRGVGRLAPAMPMYDGL